MPRSCTTLKPGHKVNPGGFSRPELQAKRTISEALRGLASPEELGQTLLTIFAGIDPHTELRASKRKHKNADSYAVPEPDGPDWTTRMQALKMFIEYGYGKPLQGVLIQAEVDQKLAISGAPTSAFDLRSMPAEVRQALRLVASAALGQPLPAAPEVSVPAAPPSRPDIELAETIAPAGGEGLSLDDVLALDDDGLEIPTAEPAVHIEFPSSTNLVSASLEDGICTVSFRVADGAPKTYQYRNVTPAMMKAWREAPSAGAWFAREIRARHQQYPLTTGVIGGYVRSRGGAVL